MLSLRGPNVCVVLPLGQEALPVASGQLLQLVSLTAEQAVQWPGSTGSAEVPQVGVELPGLCMQVAPGALWLAVAHQGVQDLLLLRCATQGQLNGT
jgi:hypothetical protein